MRDIRVYLLLILGCLALGAQALPQDDDETAEEPAAGENGPAEAEEAEEAAGTGDELVIDDESYVDIEEEDFRPTEEIDADQSIPFPTDI